MGKNVSKIGMRGNRKRDAKLQIQSGQAKLSSSPAPPPEPVAGSSQPSHSDLDQAFFALQQQHAQFHKNAENLPQKEHEIAKQLLQNGKQEGARILLKKKQFQDYVLEQTQAQIESIKALVKNEGGFHKIPDSDMEAVWKHLHQGNQAASKAEKLMTIGEIEKILLEGEAGQEKQAEIGKLLQDMFPTAESEILEQKVETELEGMQMQVKLSLPLIFFEESSSTRQEEVKRVQKKDATLHISSFTAVSQPKAFAPGVDSELEFIATQVLTATKHADTIKDADGTGSEHDVQSIESSPSDLPLRPTVELSRILPDVPMESISEDIETSSAIAEPETA